MDTVLEEALEAFNSPRDEMTPRSEMPLFSLISVSYASFLEAHPQTNITEEQFEQTVRSYGHQILNFGNNELRVEPGIDSSEVALGQQVTFRVRAGVELAARLFKSPFFDLQPDEPFLPVRIVVPSNSVPYPEDLSIAEDRLRKVIKRPGGVHVGRLRVVDQKTANSAVQSLKRVS